MSTSIFETGPAGPSASFNKWDIPVRFGLLLGIIGVILSTVNFMFLLKTSYVLFLVMTAITVWVVPIIFYAMTGIRQRKAMGGYINIKWAFQAIFITILISSVITSIWGIIYAKYIDPEVGVRMKEATIAFMERMKVPESKMDETVKNMDKQLAEGMKPAKMLYAFAKDLIFQSIIGFIIAAIIRKNPPAYPA